MPDPVTISVTVDARQSTTGVRQVEVELNRLGQLHARMTSNMTKDHRQLAQAINQSFELNRAGFARMIQHQEREMRTFRDRRVQVGRDAARTILAIEQKLAADIQLVNERSNRRLIQLAQRRNQELSRLSQKFDPTTLTVTRDAGGRYRTAGGVFASQQQIQDFQKFQQARAQIDERYNNLEVAQTQRTADRVYDLRRAGQAKTEKVQQDGLKKLESIQKGEEAATFRHRNQIATFVENSARSTNAKVQQMAKETAFSFESIFGANFFANLAANALQNLVSQITSAIKESVTYAARTEELGVAMESMAKASNISSAAIQAQANIVSRLNITTQETRVVLTRMLQAQLDVSKATDLAVAAQDLAVVTGTATAETYERLILGITTMQPRILRTAGVFTTLTELMRDNREETGQSAISLSSYQKQQLLLNEVLKQAARDVGNYDAAMNTAGKQMRSSIRIVDDLKNQFGQQFLPLLFVIIKELNRLGDAFTKDIGKFDLVLGLVAISFGSFALSAIRAIPVLKALAGSFLGLFSSIKTAIAFGTQYIANTTAQAGSTRALAVAQLEQLGIARTATVQSAIAQANKIKEITLLEIEFNLRTGVITQGEAETLKTLALTDAKIAENAATVALVNSERGLLATSAAATGGLTLIIAAVVTLGVYLASTSDAMTNFSEVTADQAAEGIRLLNVLALQNEDLAQAQNIIKNVDLSLEENVAAYKKVVATLDLINSADRSRIITQNAVIENTNLVNELLQKQINLNKEEIRLKQERIALTLNERTATYQNAQALALQADEDLKVLQGLQKRLELSGKPKEVVGGTAYYNLDEALGLTNREQEAVQRNASITTRIFGDLNSVIGEASSKLGEQGEAYEKAKADIEVFSEQVAKNIVQLRKNQILQGETVEVYGESRQALKQVGQTNEYVVDTVDKYIRKLEQANAKMHTAEKAAEDLSDALNKIKAPDIDFSKTLIAFPDLQKQLIERRRLLFEAIQQNVIPRQLSQADVENVLGVGAKDFISAQEKFFNAFKAARGSTTTIEEFRAQLQDATSEASKFVRQQIAIADTSFAKALAESGTSIENWNEEAKQAVIESAKLAAAAKEENLFTITEKQVRSAGGEIANLRTEIGKLQGEIRRLSTGNDEEENLQRQKRRLEETRNLVRSIYDTANETGIKIGTLPDNEEALRSLNRYLDIVQEIEDAHRELRLPLSTAVPGDEQGARTYLRFLEKIKEGRDQVRQAAEAQLDVEAKIAANLFILQQHIEMIDDETLAQERYLTALRERETAEQELTADITTLARRRLNLIESEAQLVRRAYQTIVSDTLSESLDARFEAKKAEIQALLISARDRGDEGAYAEIKKKFDITVSQERNQTLPPVLKISSNTENILKLLGDIRDMENRANTEPPRPIEFKNDELATLIRGTGKTMSELSSVIKELQETLRTSESSITRSRGAAYAAVTGDNPFLTMPHYGGRFGGSPSPSNFADTRAVNRVFNLVRKPSKYDGVLAQISSEVAKSSGIDESLLFILLKMTAARESGLREQGKNSVGAQGLFQIVGHNLSPTDANDPSKAGIIAAEMLAAGFKRGGAAEAFAGYFAGSEYSGRLGVGNRREKTIEYTASQLEALKLLLNGVDSNSIVENAPVRLAKRAHTRRRDENVAALKTERDLLTTSFDLAPYLELTEPLSEAEQAAKAITDELFDFGIVSEQVTTAAVKAWTSVTNEFTGLDAALAGAVSENRRLREEYADVGQLVKQVNLAREVQEGERLRDTRKSIIEIQLLEEDLASARTREALYVSRVQIRAEQDRKNAVKTTNDEIIALEAELVRKRVRDPNYLREIQEQGNRERLSEENELRDQIELNQDRIANFGVNSALKFEKAWTDAYLAIKQSDEDAVVSQIQSQVRLDDALTLHTQQVRASVYEHLASQKTYSESIADGITSLYDNVFEKMSDGIDRLTQKWGAFGNFFNGVLKSISAQLLNRATKSFVDLFFPPDNQSGLGGVQSSIENSGGGGFLGTIKNIFGLGGNRAAGSTTTAATQTMVVNAGNVIITGPGLSGNLFGGGIPGLGGIPFLGANSGLRTPAGVSLSNLGNVFSFANQFSAPTSASNPVTASWADLGRALGFPNGGNYSAGSGGGLGGLFSGLRGGTGGGLGGLIGGAASLAPLLGVGLGSTLGAGSGLGSILGGIGGGLAGLGLLGGLSAAGLVGGGLGVGASTASAGLFGALGLGGFATSIGTSIGGTLGAIASFAIPAAIIAAPLLVGAYFLARNAKRRKEEKARDQFTGDALSQLNNILRQVQQDRMDGGEAISQALQIRSQYLAAANQLTDKKTKSHALQDISRIDILVGKINYEADKQLERRNVERKLIPEFAAGGSVSANKPFSLIKVRPGEEILFPDGTSQVIPGIDRGRDSVYTFAEAGSRIFTRTQRNALQNFNYGGYVKQMRIPQFDTGGVLYGPGFLGTQYGPGLVGGSFAAASFSTGGSTNRQSAASVGGTLSTGRKDRNLEPPEPVVINLNFRGNIDPNAIVYEGLQSSKNQDVVVKINRQARNDRKDF